MLEMSGRVGGAESRCQAQSDGHALAGWLGWLDWGPVRSSIFVEQDRGGPFLKIYPCFPRRSQQEAGDRSTGARTGVDPWVIGSLGPWASVAFLCRPLGPEQWVSASMSSHAVLAREVV